MMLSPLGPITIGLLIAAVLVAVIDWILAARPVNGARWMTKGLVPTLLVLAVALHSAEQGKPSWSAVLGCGALVLCLLGDLFLLDDRRFIPGAVAFGAAHLVFVAALLRDAWSEGWPSGWGIYVSVAVVGAALLTVGWRIVSAAAAQRQGILAGVYLVVISLLVLAAGVGSATFGGWAALLGAILFYASDGILAWRRFVIKAERDSALVMIPYHLALFLLAGWALVS